MKTLSAPCSPTITSSGCTTRVFPTPSGNGSGDPSTPPLLRPVARAASANVHAPRTCDGPSGVAGPGESAGDRDAGPNANARVVGSSSSRRRRGCAREGVNTGAAGLSLVVFVLVSNAESPSSHGFFAAARVGLGGVRGMLELEFGSGEVVSCSGMLLPLLGRRLRRALFITYVGGWIASQTK
jgi:hypothetical protein